MAKLVYRWNRPKYSLRAEAGGRSDAINGQTSVHEIAGVAGSLQLPNIMGHTGRAGAEFNRNNGSNRFGGGASSRGPFGRYAVSGLHSFGNGERSTSYTGTVSAGLALDRNGIAAGGRSRTESAIIVKIRGAIPQSRFRLLIDGQPRLQFVGNKSNPVFLKPYRKYRIALRPIIAARETAFARLDTSEREVVLYPGTVRTLVWEIAPVVVVFGRVFGADGIPIGNAEIEGAIGVAETDGDGYFQAEMHLHTKRLVFVAADGKRCVARLPRLKAKDGFARISKIICAVARVTKAKSTVGRKGATAGTSSITSRAGRKGKAAEFVPRAR